MEPPMNPKYPIYIVSKGRWESRLTSKTLEKMKVPYRIVVEAAEYENYCGVIDKNKVIILPQNYIDEYNPVDQTGENLAKGSGPARNFAWDHSIKNGFGRHWVLDDNICHFYRLNRNKRIPVESGSIFYATENFVDRYENVAIAGLNYRFLCKEVQALPPFYLNTRVYSCILIKNNIPYRWRCRYNEDTDLSLRALKDGYCTVLMNAFLCGKICTMKMKGGNTDILYQNDGRLKMAQSIANLHPDVAKVSQKWGRWQHHVDYRPFQNNKLIRKPSLVIPDGVNEYGMVLSGKL